ncbi:hypothetical protein O3M35_000950 [Rhynocoris fuscipes]|uniref:Uncharacterized protein n=1 Tax=Rhynocoris fuscipes TaxID=488301 RepID=A0AAW1DQK9_9HEMI
MLYQITDFDTKRYEVIDAIKDDIPAADLKISLLLIACRSVHSKSKAAAIQWDTQRKCFLDLLQNIPGVPMLLTMYRNPNVCFLDENVLDFIHWLMVMRCDPKIESVSCDYKQILESISEPQDIDIIPNYMFHVVYCPCTRYSTEWNRNKCRFQLKYGYVAANLEDGFLKLFNGTMSTKNKLLCLNSNIKETYRQSCFQQSWCKSLLGAHIKMLLAVEFIDHPNLVNVCYWNCKLSPTNPLYNCGVEGKRFIVGDPTLARYAFILLYRKLVAILMVSTVKISPPTVRTF